jgi:hypothetical protein
MNFETNFENKKLEATKRDLLNFVIKNFSELKSKLIHQVDSIYHEEEISFFSKSIKIKNDFNNILPKSWLNKTLKDPHKIYIFNPTDFDISIEMWEDESSQDCFIDNKEKAAIQRDFISMEINSKETILICYDGMEDGLNNFLRWFLPRRLLKKNKIVFHSSCVIENDSAKVFLGHSGAGKSTMVSLRDKREHLSDDMNLIFKENGSYYVSAGAIGGLFFDQVDYSKSYPISSFSWIVQSKINKSTRLNDTKSYLKAMASVSNVFWDSLDDNSSEKIMNFVKDLISEVNFFELQFQKDKSVWNYVE